MSQILEHPPAVAVNAADRTDAEQIERSQSRARKLGLGLFWGTLFGFLLQKGGVAKYNIPIGQLLLEDFTVVKVMLSAVIVGMIGIHVLHRVGLVELHLKPTRFAANTLGGLIFGVGFALSAYCPGTGAAAIGQGNLDALVVVVGMLAGSWLFAESYGWIDRNINPVGDRGELTLHDLIPIPRSLLVGIAAAALTTVLVVLEQAL